MKMIALIVIIAIVRVAILQKNNNHGSSENGTTRTVRKTILLLASVSNRLNDQLKEVANTESNNLSARRYEILEAIALTQSSVGTLNLPERKWPYCIPVTGKS